MMNGASKAMAVNQNVSRKIPRIRASIREFRRYGFTPPGPGRGEDI
jgi:hypothetical protein